MFNINVKTLSKSTGAKFMRDQVKIQCIITIPKRVVISVLTTPPQSVPMIQTDWTGRSSASLPEQQLPGSGSFIQ